MDVKMPKTVMMEEAQRRMGFLPILSPNGPKISVPTVAPANKEEAIMLPVASEKSHSR